MNLIEHLALFIFSLVFTIVYSVFYPWDESELITWDGYCLGLPCKELSFLGWKDTLVLFAMVFACISGYYGGLYVIQKIRDLKRNLAEDLMLFIFSLIFAIGYWVFYPWDASEFVTWKESPAPVIIILGCGLHVQQCKSNSTRLLIISSVCAIGYFLGFPCKELAFLSWKDSLILLALVFACVFGYYCGLYIIQKFRGLKRCSTGVVLNEFELSKLLKTLEDTFKADAKNKTKSKATEALCKEYERISGINVHASI